MAENEAEAQAAKKLAKNLSVLLKTQENQESSEKLLTLTSYIIGNYAKSGFTPEPSAEIYDTLKRWARPARNFYIRRHFGEILQKAFASVRPVSEIGSKPAGPLFARVSGGGLELGVRSSNGQYFARYTFPFQLSPEKNWKLIQYTAQPDYQIAEVVRQLLGDYYATKLILNNPDKVKLGEQNIRKLLQRVRPGVKRSNDKRIRMAIGTPSSRRKEFLEFARNLIKHLGPEELTDKDLEEKKDFLLGSAILDQRTEYALSQAHKPARATSVSRNKVGKGTSRAISATGRITPSSSLVFRL